MVTLTLDASDPKAGKYEVNANNMTDQEDFLLAASIERVRGLIRSAPIVMPIVKVIVDGSTMRTMREGGALKDEHEINEMRARLEACLDGFVAELARPQ